MTRRATPDGLLIRKHCLSLDAAKRMAKAAEGYARRHRWNVVIAILDDGGHLLYLARMDGTQIGSIEVAQAKGRSALAFKRPTKVWEEVLAGGRAAVLGLPGVTPVEGGVPIVIAGEIVGAIGVSGVSSAQDGEIAAAGLAILNKP